MRTHALLLPCACRFDVGSCGWRVYAFCFRRCVERPSACGCFSVGLFGAGGSDNCQVELPILRNPLDVGMIGCGVIRWFKPTASHGAGLAAFCGHGDISSKNSSIYKTLLVTVSSPVSVKGVSGSPLQREHCERHLANGLREPFCSEHDNAIASPSPASSASMKPSTLRASCPLLSVVSAQSVVPFFFYFNCENRFLHELNPSYLMQAHTPPGYHKSRLHSSPISRRQLPSSLDEARLDKVLVDLNLEEVEP